MRTALQLARERGHTLIVNDRTNECYRVTPTGQIWYYNNSTRGRQVGKMCFSGRVEYCPDSKN